ncbi:MAG: hypothetical protein ACPG4N_10785 [Gammaproteobacteria bacterium]
MSLPAMVPDAVKRWRLGTRVNAWMFRAYNPAPHHLALFRMVYASFSLVLLFGYRFDWLADFPDGFFYPPPGIARLFDGFPSAGLIWLLNGLAIGCNIALLVGWRTKLASIGMALCLYLLYSLLFSLGNIYHMVLWSTTPLVMAFSGWGNSLSLDAKRAGREGPIQRWPIALMALLVGFSFFTAGYAKLYGGWLMPESAVWQHFMRVFHAIGRDGLLAQYFAGFQFRPFWDLADWYVVLFQSLFVVAALHPRSMRIFCSLALLFHIMVLLVLTISFSIHVVVFLLFIDWRALEATVPRVIARLRAFINAAVRRIQPWMLLPVWAIYMWAFAAQDSYYLVDGPTWFELFVFASAALGYASVPLLRLARRLRSL